MTESKLPNKIDDSFLVGEIADVSYHRLNGTLTLCVITNKDGFAFTGKSACIDPANFDEKVGKEIAYANAFDKMWPAYGFWLSRERAKQETVSHAKAPEAVNRTEHGLDFGQAIIDLKNGKRVARKGWNGKGMFLFLVKGEAVTDAIEDRYGDPKTKGQHKTLDAIYMHTVQGDLVPWLASQTDMLAEDWVILD